MSNKFNDKCSGYSIIEFKSGYNLVYILWYRDENDNICFFTENNVIKDFTSKESIVNFLISENLSYTILSFDLNIISSTVKKHSFDLELILNFINIVSDISILLDKEFPEPEDFDPVYDKLFFGQNLEAINPTGELYILVFTKKELVSLNQHIKKCILFMEENVFSLSNKR